MIFSNKVREDSSPKRQSEPAFDWLDRSARSSVQRVREQLEAWIGRYPAQARDELISALRSARNSQHEGGLFELLLHELLVRLGCSVEVHPEMPDTSRTPDFLVHSPKGHCFYLEATIASDREDPAAESRMATLHDTLDSLDAPHFFLDLRYEGLPSEPVPGRQIRKQIQRDLAEVDPDWLRPFAENGEWGMLPSWDFEFPGLSVEITAFPVNLDPRDLETTRAIGITMPGMRILSTYNTIGTAIRKKAGRYGDPNHPYVVAVNVLGDFPPENIDIFDALLGQEALEVGITRDGDQVQREIRKPNGVWHGPKGIQNQRVSAVLVGRGIRPWTLGSSALELFLNPWARRAYNCELTSLDRWVPQAGDAFHREAGVPLKELLGLSETWPDDPQSTKEE